MKYIAEYLPSVDTKNNDEHDTNNNEIRFSLPNDAKKEEKNKNEKNNSHNHSHNHSHLIKHKAKIHHHMHHKQEIQDIKSNAWMAVMGDGLHNFSDGLAIGF